MASVASSRPDGALAMLDPFTHIGIPSNEQLPFLPPLPETPRVPPEGSKSGYDSIKRSKSKTTLSSTASYPVLSTRQGGINTPRAVSSSRSCFALPLSPPRLNRQADEGSQPFHSLEPTTTSSINTNSMSISPVTAQSTAPNSDPLSVPSACQIPLPASPHTTTNFSPPLASAPLRPHIANPTSISSSFRMPMRADDTSLLGDCAPPSGADDDSFDFRIDEMRPKSSRKPSIDRNTPIPVESASPTKVSSATLQPRQLSSVKRSSVQWDLNRSTLLPASPAKTAHLLSPTHALSAMEPPWSGVDSTSEPAQQAPSNHVGAGKSPAKTLLLQSVSPSPGQQAAPNKSKRTFPASSSGQSLAAVGEEAEPYHAGDLSTLLPVTPARMRHLLHADQNIQHEQLSFSEDVSIVIPLFKSHKPVITPRATTTTPGRRVPSARKRADPREQSIHAADVTLDVKAMMARMSKPKRASGTEESFVDLLHGGEDDMNGMDLGGPDETFLPADLRPSKASSSSSVLPPRDPSLAKSMVQRLPSSDSAKSLASTGSRPPASERRSRRRSKSLTEVDPAPIHIDLPVRTSTRDRDTPSVRSTPRVPAEARVRPSVLPSAKPFASAASKRISLSAGAIPLLGHASHTAMQLPKSTSHSRTQSVDTTKRVAPPVSAVGRASLAPMITASAAFAAPKTRVGIANPGQRFALPRSGSTPSANAPAVSFRMTTTGAGARDEAAKQPSTGFLRAAPSSRLSRPITSSRPAGLPQPSSDGSARSARPSATASSIAASSQRTLTSKTAREFGDDAGPTTNRLSRPSGLPNPTSRLSKASMGPPSTSTSTSLSRTNSSSSASAATLKSRSMSTPASSASASASASTRPSVSVSTMPKKSSVPASSAQARIPRSTVAASSGSGRLPRPPTSRVPPPGGKVSTNAGIADLRARMDKLQARQQLTRAARQ